MKFLHPEFLFGLFAVAVPIIVHLFNFRKAKKVYFSNTRFIQEVKKSTSSKRRLKHLLILFSRILFIIFLVLAFAQPIIPSKSNIQSAENVLIYVDNSLSMTNTTAEGSNGLDVALATVERLLDIYPANTNYKLLTNNFAPYSNTLKSRDEVRELLTEIRRSHVSRSFQEINDRLKVNFEQTENTSSETYYISDFQKSTFGNNPSDLDSSNLEFLIPIVFENYSNVFVDSIYLENPFLMGTQSNKLHVILKNDSDTEQQDLNVKFYVNDIQNASFTLNLPANSSENYTIDLSMPLERINKVRLEFEEFPVAFDNEYFLVLNKSDRINIVEIKSENSPTAIEKVFGNSDLFNFTSQHLSNIDYSLIPQSDLVILNGINEIETSLSDVVRDYYDHDGSILLIPGTRPDFLSYQGISGIGLRAANNQGMQQLNDPDMNNPFYENIFESQEGNMQMPTVRPLMQWSDSRFNLLSLKNGQNYLSEIRPKLYLLAGPVVEDYGNFQRHALFVPVMYKIASMSKEFSNNLYFQISQSIINLKIDSLNRKSVFKLKSQESEFIPGQRISGDRIFLELPKFTLNSGFYDLLADDEYLFTVALNIDKNESKLNGYTREELEDMFSEYPNVSIFDAPDSQEAESDIKKLKFGTPLWKYALMLSLLFLLTEVLLIRFFR